MDKIILLDGNSLSYRAFYAMPALKNKKGLYTNSVYGFTLMLEKILADKIEYYQTTVSKDYYIRDQKKFFEKNPVYGQVLKGNIEVEKISDRQVKAEFVKEVTTKEGIKDYPSYLVFEKINGEWKIVLESDF